MKRQVDGGSVVRRGVAPADARQSFTFLLDPGLVERARREVGERDMVRSIEAALLAAIDYQLWVREVSRGKESL
jgi:hypothetical protein